MPKIRVLSLASLLAAAWLLAACAGNGIGLDQGGRPPAPGSNGNTPLTADFQSIQDHVFTPVCTVCHAGAAAPQGLRLDAANSYALLVGVPSAEVGSLLRVRPGDPGNSYLVQKLEGHAAVGAQMPLGGPYLPAATIAVIRQWITDGAMAPPAVAALGFALSVITPAPGEVLASAPQRVVMAFSMEPDQARLVPGVLLLERVAAAATGVSTPLATALHVATGNARALLLEPLQPLAPGRYRVLMPAQPGSGLADVTGAALAGAAGGASGEPIVLTDFEVSSPP